MKTIIPLVGLPKSGSTVLMSILNQNPIFTVLADSDLPELLVSIHTWASDKVKQSQLPHKNFQDSLINFCKVGSESWIQDNCPTNFLIDKSRFWIYHHHFTFKIFPKLKIILNIRDLRFVVNSFLKAEANTFCINYQTYYRDMNEDFMMQRVKHALDFWYLKGVLISLKEILEIAPKYKDQILIFRHEELILEPQNSMNRIYNFLELPNFTHNFNQIEKIDPHYDNMYLPYGNHQIQSKLETNLPNILSHLTEEHSKWILDEYDWYYKAFYPEFCHH